MASPKQSPGIPADIIDLFDKLVATTPGVERKGATMPYTSVNGHMFSYITKEHNLALRLPPAVIESFIKKYKSHLQEAYGIVQKEYVAVPNSLFKKTAELTVYFQQSFQYVSSLKPKPTKKVKTS